MMVWHCKHTRKNTLCCPLPRLLRLQTKEEMADLEAEPDMPDAMQVDGEKAGSCSLRKADPFGKRTGKTPFTCGCVSCLEPAAMPPLVCRHTTLQLVAVTAFKAWCLRHQNKAWIDSVYAMFVTTCYAACSPTCTAEHGLCCLRNTGTAYDDAAGEALWACCACGLMFPALEMPDCESTRMVLYYLLSLFKNRANFLHGNNKLAYFAFDDMCHLWRFIESKVDLHPSLALLLEQVGPGRQPSRPINTPQLLHGML